MDYFASTFYADHFFQLLTAQAENVCGSSYKIKRDNNKLKFFKRPPDNNLSGGN